MINSRACVQGPAGHEVDASRGQNPAQLLTTRSPGSLGLRLPRPEKQNPKQRHTAQDTLGISFHTLILPSPVCSDPVPPGISGPPQAWDSPLPVPHSPAHSIRFPLTIEPQNSTPLPGGTTWFPPGPAPAHRGSHRDKSGHTPPLLQAPSAAPMSLKSSAACKALQSCPPGPAGISLLSSLTGSHQAQAHLDPYPSPSLCLKHSFQTPTQLPPSPFLFPDPKGQARATPVGPQLPPPWRLVLNAAQEPPLQTGSLTAGSVVSFSAFRSRFAAQ